MTLRLGIVGLGAVAEAHLEAYEAIDEIDVVAAAEIKASRLREISEKHAFQPFSDYGAMLEKADLDMVCVLTPVNTHRAVTEAIAGAGLHVFCEKPIAVTLEDADTMVSVCCERGVKFFYGASYRFLPALTKAREMIRAGALGEVLLLTESVIGGGGPASHEPMGFDHYPAGGPGGSGMGLVDHGIHMIDTFPWLMDTEICTVRGRGNISGETPTTETMHMDFANGAVGRLVYNDLTFSTDLPSDGLFSRGAAWSLAGYQPAGTWHKHPGSIQVHGTQGALRIFHYANKLFLMDAGGVRQIPLADRPPPAQFAMQMESFARSIAADQEPEVSAESGIKALRALLAVYESHERGTAIKIADSQETNAGDGFEQ